MNIFIIHRFCDKNELKKFITKIKKSLNFKTKFLILNNSKGSSWKNKALKYILKSELILIYDYTKCLESENAEWEIKKAKNASIPIINIDNPKKDKSVALEIENHYNYTNEFLASFPKTSPNRFELYKLILSSSEALIERRQKTNVFFITMIGSIVAIGGFLNKLDVLTIDNNILVSLYCFIAVLLCNSWGNLLSNYGKLNTAKFKVIGELEKSIGDQIFNAEWIALGKGKRKEKYRSFTETEKNVPLCMAILFNSLSIYITILKEWSNFY